MKTFLIAMLATSTAFFAYMSLTMDRAGRPILPDNGVGVFFAEGDHGAVYEDGSYIINTQFGENIRGCMPQGTCND